MSKNSQVRSSFLSIAINTSLAYLTLIPLASNAQLNELNFQINDLPKSYDEIQDAPEGFFKNQLLETIAIQHWSQVEDFLQKSTDHDKSRSLTLKECIEFAFSGNPEIKSQLSELEAKRDRLVATTRSWNPTAEITSNAVSASRGEVFADSQNETDPSKANPSGSITRNRTTQTTVSNTSTGFQGRVTWNFLDFSRQPSINSASASYSAQRYGFYIFSRDLVNQIQTTYYRLVAQKDLITSYTVVARSQKQSAEVQLTRFEAGRVSLQDVGQSYAAYYNTLSQLVQSVRIYYQLSSTLARLVSLPEETFINTVDKNEFQGIWPYDLNQSISLARLNNDRIQRSLELSKASKWSGISQLNLTLPILYLQASANYLGSELRTNTYQDSESQSMKMTRDYISSSLWKRDSNYDISALFGFRWNFYQGGVNNANANAEFNRSKALEFQAESNRNLATENVRTTMNALQSLKLEFLTAEAAGDSSKIAYIAALARMNAGLTDITALNQLATQYQSAITNEIESIQTYNSRLADLYRETAIWPEEAEGIADQLLEKTSLN